MNPFDEFCPSYLQAWYFHEWEWFALAANTCFHTDPGEHCVALFFDKDLPCLLKRKRGLQPSGICGYLSHMHYPPLLNIVPWNTGRTEGHYIHDVVVRAEV